MKKITVVIPIYNSESTLHRCIDSILNQTYSDFELILVNDGSLDASAEICKSYVEKDARVRFLNKPNGGPSSARNKGLDSASGEWVTFCDSDDYVEPQWLEAFVGNCNDVQLVVQGFNLVGEKLYDTAICRFEGSVRNGVETLYKYSIPGSLCNKCLNRSLIERYNIRFNEGFRFREDEDLLLRYLYNIERMKCVSYSGYNYVVPEFDVKYESVDAFPAFMSIYKSLKLILKCEQNFITDMYIKDLAFSVFYSYDKRHVNRRIRLQEFRNEIGAHIYKVKAIPWHMRFVLGCLPTGIAHLLIEVKCEIRKISNR